MKKILILLIIALSFLCIKVDAKTLIEENVRSNLNYLKLSREVFVINNDGTFVSAASDCYFNGYFNSKNNNQFVEFSKDGNITKSEFYSYNGKYYDGLSIDNGYIYVGNSYVYNRNGYVEDGSLLISKLNKNGKVEWKKILNEDYKGTYYSVIKISDNNYVAAGLINLGSSQIKLILTKFNEKGDIIWSKISDYLINEFVNIKETSAGNILVLDQSGVLSLFDNNGNFIKNINIDYSYDYINAIIYKNDNQIYLAGKVQGEEKSYIVIININGELIKAKEYENIEIIDFDMIDEQYIIVSSNNLIDNMIDNSDSNIGYISKIDLNLNEIWRRPLSQEEGVYGFHSFFKKVENNVLVIRVVEDYASMHLIDSNGNIINQKVFSSDIEPYSASAIEINKDGSYYVAEYRERKDKLLFYFDKESNPIWSKGFDAQYNEFYAKIHKKDNILYVLGKRNSKTIIDIYGENGNLIKATSLSNEILNQGIVFSDNGEFYTLHDSGNGALTFTKYDSSLNKILTKNILEEENEDYGYIIYDFIQTSDKKLLVNVNYNKYNVNPTISKNYIIKIDTDGNIIYKKGNDSNAYLLVEDKDKNLISNSVTDSQENPNGLCFNKYNSNFELIWSKDYFIDYEQKSALGDVITNYVQFDGIKKLNDDLFIIWGQGDVYSSDNTKRTNIIPIVIINNNGDIIYDRIFGSFDNIIYYSSFYDAELLNDGTIRMIFAMNGGEGGPGFPSIIDIYYQYDITPKTSKNGKFTVDKIKAKNKEIITINVKPKLGYIVDKIILTDTKGNKTEIHDLTFEMIDDDVEIEVLFKELINPKTGFSITSIITMIGVLLYFTLRKKRKA